MIWYMDFNQTNFGIFPLSRLPFLKMAVVNTNVPSSQIVHHINVDSLVDSDINQCTFELH